MIQILGAVVQKRRAGRRLIPALLIRRRYALTAVRRETGAAAIHLRRQAPVEA